ncbi:hypothetical protein XELAEV_18031507mg [Xenopus laevis]|uniref:Uncharacterized protein n=1 Tax=Xenopus laevis TaxID=8355 RepID=A0A974CMQ0_XENLA|nr:hypothetical protein XELAEV_18031507mg [Xenopus laevis]
MHLTEYVCNDKIPRGLILDNKPNLCIKNPLITTRWHEICNKCSLDFMLLTIKYFNSEINELKLKVSTAKTGVTQALGNARAEVVFADYAETLVRLQDDVTEKKHCKDCDIGRVYIWKEENTLQCWGKDEDGLPDALRERRNNTGKYPFTTKKQVARPHDHYYRKIQCTKKKPHYQFIPTNSLS